ncbi:T6SS immunity protein Tdi1 domain-containing protein [Mesorhizobium sp.]|uniref:T6SS immunity protein Tdi1 domain-containing protein n=1 Tax=Mesorhizobium sp. TaxID=1871066 RepID=UPI00120A731E|nr:T6SS immunity protein Tdi1 domain-containing protein [Mesorhizobium sp.]TIO10575.1 MAG: DUF1851 domain-containing protein [Mesorhizobium sp.]TIO35481.1 MAG: DUF1851 domain-containing protein [Mesorhizobium sp.]
MFEIFRQNFAVDARLPSDGDDVSQDTRVAGLNELFASFGGASFKQGLYRIIRAQDMAAWNARVSLGFPEFSERITCFGYDWQGSAFAVDKQRLEQGEPGVLMFEPGTGKALKIPANIQTFHEVQVIQNADAALAANIYADWREAGGAEPAYAQCIGYKRPLFLSGEDAIENMELSDLEVYWHLMGQLIAKVKGLPPGTPVNIRNLI